MNEVRIAVIGLGYVGLPLCIEFSKKFSVVGFDISKTRVKELTEGYDKTLEINSEELRAINESTGITYSSDLKSIADCNVYIVTVPTPIDKNRRPDLRPLLSATATVGSVLNHGDLVIYESTVYPGATEEDCVPLLEKQSGLLFNRDFYCGYSPERINPGDKQHTVTSILKVTSGSTPEIAEKVDKLYGTIITAGTYKAPSIKVAEAAKVIENAQRDINIAFINELSIIFSKMGINTRDVLTAASTKWNFLKFNPGLVGGHCIGVDPYYLTHKAQELGYNPEIILAGRRLNDSMALYVANQIVKLMIKAGQRINGARILVLGVTFKENCPDIRNSKVVDLINELRDFGCQVEIYDPWADAIEVANEYNLQLLPSNGSVPAFSGYGAIVLAVAHKEFLNLKFERNSSRIIYDVKGVLPFADGAL